MNITVNSKEYPLHWGMGCIQIYCDTMECDIDGLSLIDSAPTEIKKIQAITTLILSAVQNGCEINRVPFDITYRDLQVSLDEMPQDEFTSIMTDFTKSKYLGKTIEEHLLGDVDDKKKAH